MNLRGRTDIQTLPENRPDVNRNAETESAGSRNAVNMTAEKPNAENRNTETVCENRSAETENAGTMSAESLNAEPMNAAAETKRSGIRSAVNRNAGIKYAGNRSAENGKNAKRTADVMNAMQNLSVISLMQFWTTAKITAEDNQKGCIHNEVLDEISSEVFGRSIGLVRDDWGVFCGSSLRE